MIFPAQLRLINLYDTLIFPNAEGGVDPWLAESWEVSDDGLTYTFKLREDVKFHDGSDLTASDVVYSFDRQTGIGEGFAYMLADADSATAVDDYTVEFKLAQPKRSLPSQLVAPVRSSTKIWSRRTQQLKALTVKMATMAKTGYSPMTPALAPTPSRNSRWKNSC